MVFYISLALFFLFTILVFFNIPIPSYSTTNKTQIPKTKSKHLNSILPWEIIENILKIGVENEILDIKILRSINKRLNTILTPLWAKTVLNFMLYPKKGAQLGDTFHLFFSKNLQEPIDNIYPNNPIPSDTIFIEPPCGYILLAYSKSTNTLSACQINEYKVIQSAFVKVRIALPQSFLDLSQYTLFEDHNEKGTQVILSSNTNQFENIQLDYAWIRNIQRSLDFVVYGHLLENYNNENKKLSYGYKRAEIQQYASPFFKREINKQLPAALSL